MSFTIQLRRDTANNWATANPVLIEGEFGFETDTRKAKIGNGASSYNDLQYWPDTNTLNLYGPTGSFQPGATGMGLTGDMVKTELIGGIPYYKIEGATTRMYCVRFEYDNSDNLSGSYTFLTDGPWTSTGVAIDIQNSPRPTAVFNFEDELTPPKNIYGYFYNASEDRYKLSTFGLGSIDYVTTAVLNSNRSLPTVTNDFFSNFSGGNSGQHEIELNMVASGYGGYRSGIYNIHAYVIFTF